MWQRDGRDIFSRLDYRVNLMTFRCRISLDPQILDIVSLRDIASYLLVTPVYLSRIRKNLAKKYGE